MKLLFVHDHRFLEVEGFVFSNQFPSPVLQRYLTVFDQMTVVGRKNLGESASDVGLPLATAPNVHFALQSNISSLRSFLGGRSSVKQELRRLICEHDRIIVRLPSELGLLAASIARAMGRGYAVELVGDPWEALWFHGSFLGKIYAPILARRTRSSIQRSSAVSYVTASYLQGMYPPRGGSYVVQLSNVSISSVSLPRVGEDFKGQTGRVRIGIIGSFRTRYKGIHTAIEAVSLLRQRGVDAELRVLGSGDLERYEGLAMKRGVSDRVFFDGTLPSGSAVESWLDNLDIYAQPSLTEGLPRALIEAMSRGLPAVASNVGGIPELLGDSYLFEPGNGRALADRLERLISSSTQRAEASLANLAVATEYLASVLERRRIDFLRAVAQANT